MKHLGDICKINGAEAETVDCIIGGSPCQDLSVAGKRAGLAGERSGLFMEQVRIVKEMRAHGRKVFGWADRAIRPRYMVWENVPGALSSNKGKDFAAVLEETVRIAEPKAPDIPVPCDGWSNAGLLVDVAGGWSVAWRIHDAQFWGVPQRRRRIAVVADFGGLTAGEILFERESLSGDIAESGETREGVAGGVESGAGTTEYLTGWDNQNRVTDYTGIVTYAYQRTDELKESQVSSTQSARQYKSPTDLVAAVGCRNGTEEVNDGIKALQILRKDYGDTNVLEWAKRVQKSIQKTDLLRQRVHESGISEQAENGNELDDDTLPRPELVAEWLMRDVRGHQEHRCSSQRRKPSKQPYNEPTKIVQELPQQTAQTSKELFNMWKSGQGLWILREALSAVQKMGKSICVQGEPTHARNSVRRLTPLEAERLQGFPSTKELKIGEMTKDEYIAWNIAEGNIIVDCENGKIFATRGPGGVKLDKPKELSGSIVNGYRVVSIRNKDVKLQCRVHRIVWVAARGIIPDGYVIDHINNDKLDNRICNLQVLTPGQNSTKAKEDGLYLCGDKNPATKLSELDKTLITLCYAVSDTTIRDLAKIFGVSKSRVHQIIHERGWTDIPPQAEVTAEDLSFWREVWDEWDDMNGKKRHTDKQIVKWLQSEPVDSARYKALGNSIALPFWLWLCKRISDTYDHAPTLGSLFDGIGGFPLIWEYLNGKGTAAWASEVEPFPIKVTKYHFKEDT